MHRLPILLVILSTSVCSAETFSLLLTRNLHGEAAKLIGAGMAAASVKQAGGAAILLDSGAALSASEDMFDHRRQGSLSVALMNQSGYAGWFLSHRDLAWSDRLTSFLRRTDFPVLSANSHRPETGRHLFQVQPYSVLRVAGHRVGVIGLAGPASDVLTSDPVSAADYYASLIAPRCDLVVVASDGSTESESQIANLASVDLVIGVGSSESASRVGSGWVLVTEDEPGLWGIDVSVYGDSVTSIVSSRMAIPAVDPAVIREALVGWTANLEGEPVSLGTVIGRSEGGFQRALTSPLGYFVADVVQAAAETDGALIRTSHVPDDFVTGDISVYDLLRAYSLPYTIGIARIKGHDLTRLLDLSGGELTFYPSGISVVYGGDENGGSLVASTINGNPIDPRVDYTVAVEYGATADPALAGPNVRDTGLTVRDVLAAHIRTSASVKGVVDGRVQRR